MIAPDPGSELCLYLVSASQSEGPQCGEASPDMWSGVSVENNPVYMGELEVDAERAALLLRHSC